MMSSTKTISATHALRANSRNEEKKIEKGMERNERYGMEYSGARNTDAKARRKNQSRSRRLLRVRTVPFPKSEKNFPAVRTAHNNKIPICRYSALENESTLKDFCGVIIV